VLNVFLARVYELDGTIDLLRDLNCAPSADCLVPSGEIALALGPALEPASACAAQTAVQTMTDASATNPRFAQPEFMIVIAKPPSFK